MWKITLELYDGCVVYRKSGIPSENAAHDMWLLLVHDATWINGSTWYMWHNGHVLKNLRARNAGHDMRGDWDEGDDND